MPTQQGYIFFMHQPLLSRPDININTCMEVSMLELASERSKRDTIRDVQIRAGVVYIYIYIYILCTPPRSSLEINVFELV